MTTALSIIEQGMRKISALGVGEALSAEDGAIGLQALNNLLERWSIEGGMVYTQAQETFALTGQEKHTVGTGGDINTTPFIDIDAMFVTNGDVDYPLRKMNAREYAEVAFKGITGIPDCFYYDNNRPLAGLFLYPVPDASYTVTVYSRKPITEFALITDSITLPTGVENALVYSLAVELAPEYGKEPSPSVRRLALKGEKSLRAFNSRNNYPTSKIDLACGGVFNIYEGRYR